MVNYQTPLGVGTKPKKGVRESRQEWLTWYSLYVCTKFLKMAKILRPGLYMDSKYMDNFMFNQHEEG